MRVTEYERQVKRIKLSKPWFSKICRECGDMVGGEYMYSSKAAYCSLLGDSIHRTYTCSNCAQSYNDVIRQNHSRFGYVEIPEDQRADV